MCDVEYLVFVDLLVVLKFSTKEEELYLWVSFFLIVLEVLGIIIFEILFLDWVISVIFVLFLIIEDVGEDVFLLFIIL